MLDEPKQDYKYQETLANIGVQIAKGRAELADIEATKEKYFEQREQEALKRVNETLKASENALAAARSNQKELALYQQVLTDYAQSLISLRAILDQKIDDFVQKSSQIWAEIEQKQVDLAQIEQEHKMAAELIKADRLTIEAQRKQIASESKNIESKQQMLKNAFEELKKRTK